MVKGSFPSIEPRRTTYETVVVIPLVLVGSCIVTLITSSSSAPKGVIMHWMSDSEV